MAALPLFRYASGMTELLRRITINTEQCHGRPCIRGLRIRVADILEMLASGIAADEILQDFPDLEPDDIRACEEYFADQFIARNRDALNESIRRGREELARGDILSTTIDDIIAEGRTKFTRRN